MIEPKEVREYQRYQGWCTAGAAASFFEEETERGVT
jgi:hypothetical protein